eukprot:GHVQ01038688.1.p1 GENE.GHVQ01038688.1~~GHVQ01038688.1.p1  ORF type:complete len:370 (-),score=8.62 GHVQ01038688.1:170-1279(-)
MVQTREVEYVPLQPFLVSPLNVVVKTSEDGRVTTRIIIDFTASGLNDCLHAPPMTMPSIADIVRHIKPDDCLGTADISEAFTMLPMQARFVDHLGIKHPFNNRFMRFRQGSFGLRTMSWLFSQATIAIHIALVKAGIRDFVTYATNYVDDFILIATTEGTARQALALFQKTCHNLGWYINPLKTKGPAQKLTFIGFILDTVNMQVSVSEAKCAKATTIINALLNRGHSEVTDSNTLVNLWDTSKVVGFLCSINIVTRTGFLILRELWTLLAVAQDRKTVKKSKLKRLFTHLSEAATSDLHTWLHTLRSPPVRNMLKIGNSFHLWSGKEVPTLDEAALQQLKVITTDASKKGWGASSRSHRQHHGFVFNQ